MNNEITIQASIISDDTCQFTIDRPVYPGQSVYFSSKNTAAGSPLAEKIFEIENVVELLVSDTIVKVTKKGNDEWLPMARQIGSFIRAQLQSGIPPISGSISANLPDEGVLRERIQQLLEEQVNPAVASHGGHVDLIDVKGNRVFLQLGGGCQGCGMAQVTLRQGIEQMIRKAVPEVGEILDVTDHAGGRNPYYARQ